MYNLTAKRGSYRCQQTPFASRAKALCRRTRNRLLASITGIAVSIVLCSAATAADRMYSDYETSKIARGLLGAQLAMHGNQFVEPPEDNALLHLEQVLELDPGNQAASVLLHQLIVRYTMSADLAADPSGLKRLRDLYTTTLRLPSGGHTDPNRRAWKGHEAAHHDQRNRRSPSQKHDTDELIQQRITELRDCHVESGSASLRQGDKAEAVRRMRRAADLSAEHGLADQPVQELSRKIDRQQRHRWYRVYGTF